MAVMYVANNIKRATAKYIQLVTIEKVLSTAATNKIVLCDKVR